MLASTNHGDCEHNHCLIMFDNVVSFKFRIRSLFRPGGKQKLIKVHFALFICFWVFLTDYYDDIIVATKCSVVLFIWILQHYVTKHCKISLFGGLHNRLTNELIIVSLKCVFLLHFPRQHTVFLHLYLINRFTPEAKLILAL